MKDNNKKIIQLIRNKQYFESGIKWYYDKYLGFFWEKKLFAIMSIPLIIVLVVTLVLNYDQFSLEPEPFRVSSYLDTSSETMNIKKLKDKKEKNTNILIARYILSKYVLAYESLKKEEIEANERFILENSSNLIYFSYKKRNETLDENNPFINSARNQNIFFEIEDIKFFLNDENLPFKGIVSVVQKNLKNELEQKRFKIEIDFLMDNILFINKDFDRLNFLVLKYKKI
jgi:type IV secretory pathway component VirB8